MYTKIMSSNHLCKRLWAVLTHCTISTRYAFSFSWWWKKNFWKYLTIIHFTSNFHTNYYINLQEEIKCDVMFLLVSPVLNNEYWSCFWYESKQNNFKGTLVILYVLMFAYRTEYIWGKSLFVIISNQLLIETNH